MSLVRIIAGQSLRQRPGRTLFSILGIAVGIATVVGVFTLDHNTVVGLSLKSGAGDWKPAIEVRPAPNVPDPGATLGQTPGVLGYSPFFQNDVVVRRAKGIVAPPDERSGARNGARGGSRNDGTQRVRLFALDASALTVLDAVHLAAGALLDPGAKAREVLVGDTLAGELGLEVGDDVLLARPPRQPREACVDGVVKAVPSDGDAAREVPVEESFRVAGILLREKLGRRSQGNVVVADSHWARDLFRGAAVDPVYWVSQDPKVDIERLRASLGTAFSYELNKSVLVGAAADERAFRNGVRMAGLFALVLGLYVIFHTLSMSLVERVREVATLHALGTSRRQIAHIFFAEALVIAAGAAVLGLAGGLAMARVLLVKGVTTLGTGHRITTFDVPWGAVSGLVALGVGIALLGSVYPLLRARNSSTVAALRGEEALRSSGVARGFHLFAALLLAGLLPAIYFVIVPVVGEAQKQLVGAVLAAVGFLALFVTLPLLVPALLGKVCAAIASPLRALWPFSGRFAAQAMRSSPARIAVSSAAIALVAAAFVGLKSMTASLQREIEQWADTALVDKVYVRGLPSVRYDDLHAHLSKYPGVVGIESGSARSYVPFLLLGMRSRELIGHGPCKTDRALLARLDQGDAVILSGRLARHLGYKVGDKVHVSNASGAVQDLEVIAVSDAYGYFPHPDERLYGVTSDKFMKRAFCIDVDTLNECAVVLERGTDPNVVQAAVTAMFPDAAQVRFETGQWLLQAHIKDLDYDFRLFDMILSLSALLAALGVLNGQLLSALERAKELGILRALGVTHGQVAGAVLCEAVVIGVFGGLLGTLLGASLAPIIIRALESLSGLALPLAVDTPWLWMCPLGAVALALIAALYPITRMNRTDAVAAVRAP